MARRITNRLIQRVRRHQNMTTIFRSSVQGQPVGMAGSLALPYSGEPSRLVMGQMPVMPTALANAVIPVSEELSAPQLSLAATENIALHNETGVSSEPPQSLGDMDPVERASAPLQAPVQLQRATTTHDTEPASIVADWPDRSRVSSSPSNQQVDSRGDERSFVEKDATNRRAATPVPLVPSDAVQMVQEPPSGAMATAGEATNSRQESTTAEPAEDDRIWSRLKVIHQAHARKQTADETPVQRSAVAQGDMAASNLTRRRAQSAPRPTAVQRSQNDDDRNRRPTVIEERSQPVAIVRPAITPPASASSEAEPVAAAQDDQGTTDQQSKPIIASHPNQQAALSTEPGEQQVQRAPDERSRAESPSVSPSAAAEAGDVVVDVASLNPRHEVAEANPLEEPALEAAEPESERPSLDQVWPVQRTTETDERFPTDANRPNTTDVVGGDNDQRAVSPDPEHVTVQHHALNETVQAALQNVPPARSTESAVHIMAPRRPRPVRQRREQQIDTPPEFAPQPATDSQRAEQQESSAIQAKADDQQPDTVVTEIGELPRDLWSLIDEPIPTHYDPTSSTGRAGKPDSEVAAPKMTKPQDVANPTAVGTSPEAQRAHSNESVPSEAELNREKAESTDRESLGEQAMDEFAVDTPYADASTDLKATSAVNAVQREQSDKAANLPSGTTTTPLQSATGEALSSTTTEFMHDSPVVEHLSIASAENLDMPSNMPFLQNGSQHNRTNAEIEPIARGQEAVHRVDKHNASRPVQRHTGAATAPLVMKASLPDEDEAASSIGDSLEGNDADLDLLMNDLDANPGADASTRNRDEDESSDTEQDGDHDEDISELARQVYAYLQRRLVVERERMG